MRHEIMKKILKKHGLDDMEIEQVFKEFDVEAKKMLKLELTPEKLQKDLEAIVKKAEQKREGKGHINFRFKQR